MNDEKQAAHALKVRQARQRVINAWARILESDDGKIVWEDLQKTFGLEAPVFRPIKASGGVYQYDPLTAALGDGARQVLIYIKKASEEPAVGDANHTEPAVKAKHLN